MQGSRGRALHSPTSCISRRMTSRSRSIARSSRLEFCQGRAGSGRGEGPAGQNKAVSRSPAQAAAGLLRELTASCAPRLRAAATRLAAVAGCALSARCVPRVRACVRRHLQDVGQDLQRLGHVLLKHLGVVARLQGAHGRCVRACVCVCLVGRWGAKWRGKAPCSAPTPCSRVAQQPAPERSLPAAGGCAA